jgi:formylglycine-generating enzyme
MISWDDAAAFCNWLSALENLPSCYQEAAGGPRVLTRTDGYRLPSEAEWEFACRSGSDALYPFGNDDSLLNRYGWFMGIASSGKPRRVGSFRPNAFGLHDMLGNVQEFCHDCFSPTAYTDSDQTDPFGPATAAAAGSHTVRGGAWNIPAQNCRNAFRRGCANPNDATGIRVVRGF